MRVRLAMRDITDDVSAKYSGGDRQRPIYFGILIFFVMLARLARI